VESQEEETKKDQIPLSSPSSSDVPKQLSQPQYPEQLKTLLHMGFDYSSSVEILNRSNGDLVIALNELLA